MDAREVGKLLGAMALYDNRTLSEADVVAWLAVAGDLAYADAHQAVIAYYRESRERIMPADIRERVAAVRKQRLEDAPPVEIPEELADKPAEALVWKQRVLAAIMDGREPNLAIEAAP